MNGIHSDSPRREVECPDPQATQIAWPPIRWPEIVVMVMASLWFAASIVSTVIVWMQ
jgi:hypothetical protein